jgi:hypothetical protein
MSLVTRLFHRRADEAPVEPIACGHLNLAARWDDAEDIGKPEKATSYNCMACSETFTSERAQALRLPCSWSPEKPSRCDP